MPEHEARGAGEGSGTCDERAECWYDVEHTREEARTVKYIIRDNMNAPVFTAMDTMDLREAATLLVEEGITGAPVVDELGSRLCHAPTPIPPPLLAAYPELHQIAAPTLEGTI
jgi:hypothetical protein